MTSMKGLFMRDFFRMRKLRFVLVIVSVVVSGWGAVECGAVEMYGGLEADSLARGTEPVGDNRMEKEFGEVMVCGEKPQLRGEDGILTVDLPSIVRDKPVTNIYEALSYLPGTVNDNGRIGLAGASSVAILLNGELTNMPLDNLYQLLYSLPIDRLKTVEIMYSAPAKYHVSGAVINIVLKTPRPIDGLMGQTRLGYTQAHYASGGAGITATYALKDWAFDFSYSLSRERGWNRQETFSNHLVGDRRTMIEDDMRQIKTGWRNTLYASAAYRKMKISYNGQISARMKGESLSAGTLGVFNNVYDFLSPIQYHNVAVRYEAPIGLTAGGDYTLYTENRCQHLMAGGDERVNADNRQDINRYHVYVDQTHRFGSWQLSYGAEYQHSDDRSRQYYLLPEAGGFDETLREDVAGVYVGVQGSMEWGLSFNASAKAEYFHNSLRHSWDYIPQLGATYYKTPTSIFQLNFMTRRVYPSYWELHGATSYINNYAAIHGNSELQPYILYAGQLSYIFRQKYAATFYVQYADRYSVQLPYQAPDRLNLVFQTLNMNYDRKIGINLNASFNAGYIWNIQAMANLYLHQAKADRFHEISYDNRRMVLYGAVNNTFRFSRNCPVSLSVDFTGLTPSIQGIGNLSGLWKMDVGVKWQFGVKRVCELTLRCVDLFNRWSPTMTIRQGGQDYRMKMHDMTRQLNLSFIWRFNGFKPKQDSGIDTSRFGTGG